MSRNSFATLLSALIAASCAAPAILGHNDPHNTHVACPDGLSCPIGFACPTVAGGSCEAESRITEQWMTRDAGQ